MPIKISKISFKNNIDFNVKEKVMGSIHLTARILDWGNQLGQRISSLRILKHIKVEIISRMLLIRPMLRIDWKAARS